MHRRHPCGPVEAALYEAEVGLEVKRSVGTHGYRYAQRHPCGPGGEAESHTKLRLG